jgi:integrase
MPVYEKKGRYYCVYYDGPKRIWEPFGNDPDSKRGAEARDLEIKLKKRRSQWYLTARSHTIMFSELAQIYIDVRKTELSIRTLEEILRTLSNYINPIIGTKFINTIDMRDWNKIQQRMMQGVPREDPEKQKPAGNRSINKYFQYISKTFDWAVENDYLTENPWRKRKPLRNTAKFKVDLLELKELQKIIEIAPEHLKWAIEVGYNTGARPGPSELFALQWQDIDWRYNRIRIPGSKTDKSNRWQYLSDNFMDKLREKYLQRDGCTYVVSYKGTRIISNLKRSWEKAKRDAGITRRIRLYDIRHFYITYALAMGADIAELAERVGNSPETITRYYLHLAKDLQRKEAFRIPSLSQTVEQTVERNKKEVRIFSVTP